MLDVNLPAQIPLHYDKDTNTVTLGELHSAMSEPVLITLPQLHALLVNQQQLTLLHQQAEGVWLLTANLLIYPPIRLEITEGDLSWLRLESTAQNFVTIKTLQGGHLRLEGVKVTSWDSEKNAVDELLEDGRSYLLARAGGRLDILRSEVAYLGWRAGEASGLAWRLRTEPADAATGATGVVEDSDIHHNYFGIYTFEAYGLKILRTRVHDNTVYGIDPHDDSRDFEVAYNVVYNNGKHGIIFSRHCRDNHIHHNRSYDNAGHGIMLDRETNHNLVEHNLVYNNLDGIAIYQSDDNVIQFNTIRHNQRGIRINATHDAEDRFDDISVNNIVRNNTIEENRQHGVYLYARADHNIIEENLIAGSGENGVYVKSGGNIVRGNTVRDGKHGITILGGEYLNFPPVAVPAREIPGNQNVIQGNVIISNTNGIRIVGGASNQIGLDPTAPNRSHANIVEANRQDGIILRHADNGAQAIDNIVAGNRVQHNGRHDIYIDKEANQNLLQKNQIIANDVQAMLEIGRQRE